jgi:2-aminoadipate transaminase
VLPPVPLLKPGALGEVMRLAQQQHMLSFAQASAAPETFPLREFARTVQHVLADAGPELYDYGMTQGDITLRQQLSLFLLDRGLAIAPEHLLVVAGAQQGLDIVLRALVSPGDTVLVEGPTYLGMIERMQMQGLKLVAVPLDEQGIRPDALETAIALHQPRLLYTIPTFHNPTGISMSPERQEALLDIAQRHALPILEDDIYGLLSYDNQSPLPLKARDTTGIVTYLTSFSKVLMPGLRLGLLAAAPPLLDALTAVKRFSDMHSPQLTQRALALYLERGLFAGHLRGVTALYRERRDARVTFPSDAEWTVPHGGLCCWVGLPAGLQSADLYLAAIERGVAFAPDQMFFPEQPAQGFMRLSFAAHSPAEIDRGIAVLGELINEHLVRRQRLRAPSFCDAVPMV